MFLLDTSAFRALSKIVLKNLREQGYELYASPYEFWELLCHLDEDFKRYKSILMKFIYVDVLDDPRAMIETLLIPGDEMLQERVSDIDIIYSALGALQSADSLADFYSSYIRDSNNNLRMVEGCAKREREILDTRERNYITLVTNLMDSLSSGSVNISSNEEYHRAVISLAYGHYNDIIERGALEDGLLENVIHDTYIYNSYIAHNAVRYYKNRKTHLTSNDYEDACMCLHLKLDTPYRFVTNDRNLRETLEQTINLIEELNDPELRTTLEVYDTAYLESLV